MTRQPIRKAVFPVAGLGTRFLPATKAMPEETNRKLVDHISDFNLVYTEHARRHLLSEGVHHRRIYLTGSPMREVLDHYRSRIEASDVLARLGLSERGYFIVSLHREENVDSAARLRQLVSALNALATQHDMNPCSGSRCRQKPRPISMPGVRS